MSKQPETRFKERVMRDVKTLGQKVYCRKIQMVAVRGVPDLILGVSGRLICLELKRSTTARIDPLQLHEIELIQRAGCVAMVVSPETWPDVFEWLTVLASLPSAWNNPSFKPI